MSDMHSKEVRSYNMSKIRSKDTKPELLVRKYLHKHGFRFRLHVKNLAGKPDVVLPKYRTIIFVHGCFWHGHEGCKYYVIPKSRTEWWRNKIFGNKMRDALHHNDLEMKGWCVIDVWECDLKKDKFHETLHALMAKILSLT